MTEGEWLTTRDYAAMLEHLRGQPNEEKQLEGLTDFALALGKGLLAQLTPPAPSYADRKWRLFNCACCRAIGALVEKYGCGELVEISEKYADRRIGKPELRHAAAQAEDEYHAPGADLRERVVAAVWGTLDDDAAEAAYEVAETTAYVLADALTMRLLPGWEPGSDDVERWTADRLRDVFGNPFRRGAGPRQWRSANVAALARSIYDERAFDRLPILADALEDAGCTDGTVLDHCRQPGEHVRGCWVVDLALGMK